MLFAAASHVPLMFFAATFLSTTSSRGATLERLSAVPPRNVSVSYDPMYDEGGTPATAVACSDWMVAKGYPTLSGLPSFPHVAGADIIDGSNSALCGQCWELSYDTPTETSIHVVVVDSAARGFTIAKRAMDDLTDGRAAALGRAEAVARVVARQHCGMQ